MKKVTKDNRKPYIYTAINISVVVIIFAILNLWSIGDFENYKKISKFKSVFLSKSLNFKKSPPNELFGVKLYDNFEKYLLVNKSEIRIDEFNNTKYYEIISNSEKKIKFTNPLPEYIEHVEFYVKENGEIAGINFGYEIRLNNNNNILNFCTKTRNSFLRQHNLSKLNFNNEYYILNDKEFFDFKSFDFQINNNNARFSIACAYQIKEKSIDYIFILFLHDVNMWKDLAKENDLKITSKKINSNDIRKYRDK